MPCESKLLQRRGGLGPTYNRLFSPHAKETIRQDATHRHTRREKAISNQHGHDKAMTTRAPPSRKDTCSTLPKATYSNRSHFFSHHNSPGTLGANPPPHASTTPLSLRSPRPTQSPPGPSPCGTSAQAHPSAQEGRAS